MTKLYHFQDSCYPGPSKRVPSPVSPRASQLIWIFLRLSCGPYSLIKQKTKPLRWFPHLGRLPCPTLERVRHTPPLNYTWKLYLREFLSFASWGAINILLELRVVLLAELRYIVWAPTQRERDCEGVVSEGERTPNQISQSTRWKFCICFKVRVPNQKFMAHPLLFSLKYVLIKENINKDSKMHPKNELL